jgi:YegS/Rv2252/BmrU family lipid kinase
MQDDKALKLLFIINKGSGKDDNDWQTLIRNYFEPTPHSAELFDMPDECCMEDLEKQVEKVRPDRVIAVGGDGTVKLVAECCMKVNIPLGILPAGSANGMAKELKIPIDATKALANTVHGITKKIHLTKVNDELCIHLADMGFNAFVIKKFDTYESRGMWGYVKAAWSALRSNDQMQVEIKVDGEKKQKSAAMIVIANATMYGTGALINPEGSLEDELFEVIVVKKISFKEIFKMIVTHQPYDPAKTEVYQTGDVQISSKKKAHFQVDGEYLGKVNKLEACIVKDALEIIVPAVE